MRKRLGPRRRRFLRAAVAAYNSGAGNVVRALAAGLDVDYYTAGRNYSSDVLDRAGWLHAHEATAVDAATIAPDVVATTEGEGSHDL